MPQSSLMKWLSKPAAVAEPSPVLLPPTVLEPTETNDTHTPPPPADANSNDEEVENAPISAPKLFLQPSNPPLPPNIELRGPTKEDMPSFKKLNSILLPIPYPESFYKEILSDPVDRSITLMARLALRHRQSQRPAGWGD
jgi:hypothetical protein